MAGNTFGKSNQSIKTDCKRMAKYRKLSLLKRLLLISFVAVLFFMMSAFALYKFNPKTYQKYKKQLVTLDKTSAKKTLPRAEVVEAKPEIKPVISKKKLRKDLIFLHRIAANKNGVSSIKTKSDLDALVKSKKLVKVANGIGYKIGVMTHSYPYLTPNAKTALQKIGISFAEHSKKGSYFTITSLTRTEETQKKLQKSNSNATREGSTHCHGVSFDISYIRYNGKRGWDEKLTKTLEGVLAAMQLNNEIYVVKESKQSCYHITVRN